jgi:hypothetical protein
MPRLVQTVSAQPGETRLAGTASGVALTTTAVRTSLIPGTQLLTLTPRNFAGAVVCRYALCPYLAVLTTRDNLKSQPLDSSYLLQDGDNTATLIMNSFDTLANNCAMYVGSYQQFRGLDVDVQNTNGTANTLAAKYSAGGLLTTLSITDNTDTGPSLAQDGTITWTVPSDWAAGSFNELFGTNFPGALYNDKMFWLRFDWSVALDSSTSLNQIRSLPRSTSYDELAAGQFLPMSVDTKLGPTGVAAIEALTDGGTANLLHSCATLNEQKFAPVAAISRTA